MQLLTDQTQAMLGVAIATEPGRLETERTALQEMISQAQTCVVSSKRAQTHNESLQDGIRDCEAKRDGARVELNERIAVALPEVLLNPAADESYHAKALAEARGWVQLFVDALEFACRVEVPKLRLAGLEADLALAEAYANIANKQAEIAAAERMLASKDLLEAEGTISFAREGRTYQLLEASWRACALAATAREALENEVARQNKSKQVLGSITQHHVGNLF